MPEFTAAAAAYVAAAAAAATGASIATAITVITIAAQVGALVGTVLLSAAINYGLNALFGPEQGLSDVGRVIESEGGVRSQNLIYGTQRVAGHAIAETAWPKRAGRELKMYARVKAIAGHEISGIDQWWVDGREVTPDADGFIFDAPFGAKGISFLQVFSWLGRPDEPRNELFELYTKPRDGGGGIQTAQQGWWRETDRSFGKALIGLIYEFDGDVYADGPYPRVQVTARGRKVYDPRRDSTNGGDGPQRADDPATWEYSANWALCVTDFWRSRFGPHRERVLAYPGGVWPAEFVSWSHVRNAANVSDQVIDLIEDDWWERRWELHAFIEDVGNPRAVLGSMVRHAGGWYSDDDGVLRLEAGGYVPPVSDVAFDHRYIAGEVSILRNRPVSERFSSATGTYVSPEAGYAVVQYPEVESEALKSRDNGRRSVKPFNFPWCVSPNQARRAASIALGRQLAPVEIPRVDCFYRTRRFLPGDVVPVTLNGTSVQGKTMRIESLSYQPNGSAVPCSVSLRETSPEVFVDPPLVARNAGAGEDVVGGLDNTLTPVDGGGDTGGGDTLT